jgi:hypothetical protein
MITQTTVMTRPDASVPWFNDAPSMQDYLAPRNELRISRPDLANTPIGTESEDKLTYTAVQTFPDVSSFNQYLSLLKQAIPGWPEGRNKYFTDNNQTISITVTETNNN